jgi:peroxiredoxin
MLKKMLFSLIFLAQTTFLLAQKDTIIVYAHKGLGETNPAIEKSPYRIFLNAAGTTGEPVLIVIDTASIKTKKDSSTAEQRAKTFFLDSQQSYFSMLFKQMPNFEGVDFENKTLSISDFYGKKTIVYFFDASSQRSFEKIETLKRLHQKYASSGYRFLIISPNSKAELMHYDLLKALPFPVLSEQQQLFSSYCKAINAPFFSLLDEKGFVKKAFVYPMSLSEKYVMSEGDEELKITPEMTLEQISAAFSAMSANSIWVTVKNKEQILQDQDYFWNQIVAFLEQ